MLNDFLSILRIKQIPFHEHKSKSEEIFLCCPFCLERRKEVDSEFKLGLNLVKNWAHCFHSRCNWSSKKAKEQISIKLQLGEYTSQSILKEKKIERVRIPAEFERLWPVPNTRDCRQAYQYLKNRRVTDEQIEKHHIGICLAGRYAWRIVFPVKYDNKLKGLVGRDFTGKREPKYLNSQGIKSLYNCPTKKKSTAILSEGIFDVLAIERSLNNVDSIGMLGHSLSEEQIEMLEGYKRIVIFPDPDKAGMEIFKNVVPHLISKFRVEIVPSAKKDAGNMREDKIRLLYGLKEQYSTNLMLKMRIQQAWKS